MREKEERQRNQEMHPLLRQSDQRVELDSSWMDRISHRIEWRVDWQTKTGLSRWAKVSETGSLGDFD